MPCPDIARSEPLFLAGIETECIQPLKQMRLDIKTRRCARLGPAEQHLTLVEPTSQTSKGEDTTGQTVFQASSLTG